MKNAILVHIVDPGEGLIEDRLDLIFAEAGFGFAVLDHLVDVALHVLENQVEIIINTNHFLQLDNVYMIQFP